MGRFDAQGQPVPDWLAPLFANLPRLEVAGGQVQGLAGVFRNLAKSRSAECLAQDHKWAAEVLGAVARRLALRRPYTPCPCLSPTGCAGCGGKGWLSRADLAELAEQHAQSAAQLPDGTREPETMAEWRERFAAWKLPLD